MNSIFRTRRTTAVGASTLLVVLVLAACGVHSDPPDDVLPVAPGWRVELDSKLGTVRFALAQALGPEDAIGGREPAAAARALLAKHAAAFGIPLGSLTTPVLGTDSLGGMHVRFGQSIVGVLVESARVTVHFDADGRPKYITAGDLVRNVDGVDPKATVSSNAAAAIVQNDLTARGLGKIAQLPRLAFVASDFGSPKLVYLIEAHAFSTAAALRYRIDAKTGVVLEVSNEARSEMVPGKGKGLAYWVTGSLHDATDVKSFEVDHVEGHYALERLKSAAGPLVTIRSGGTSEAAITSDNAEAWDEGKVEPGSAVDAYVNILKVDDFFTTKFKRNSWDDSGAPIDIVVHPDEVSCNAYWSVDHLTFLDGDNGDCHSLAAQLDTMGHEYTHGVVQKHLQLAQCDESGALNEHIADVFGMLIQQESPPILQGSYAWCSAWRGWLGPTISPLRCMDDPSRGRENTPSGLVAPAHMDDKFVPTVNECTDENDSKYVHANSNIPSHAFYLLAHGGTHAKSGISVSDPIGTDNAGQLWYAIVTQSGLSKDAFFEDFANVSLAQARTMKLPVRPVACAWVATGVLDAGKVKRDYDVTCDATDAGTQLPSGCGDKADGFYCSEKTLYAGYFCKGGLLSGGQQCLPSQTCTGYDGVHDVITCK